MNEVSPAAEHLASSKSPLLSDGAYNKLKWVAQYFLPAVGTLYFALAMTWGLPNAEQVLGTVTALDIFLGAILGFSKKSYENSDAKYDGALIVDTSDDSKDVYRLEVDQLSDMPGKNEITLKVLPPA